MPFVNPYTFIPFPPGRGVKRSIAEYEQDREEQGTFTGKLTCHLITKTPIIIPDAEKISWRQYEGENYKDYKFFTVNGKATIPGSSLRGVIRSMFEAVTNSCVLANDELFYSRSGAPKKPGILRKAKDGDWSLYETTRYADKYNQLDVNSRTGDIVWFIGEEKKWESGGKQGSRFVVTKISDPEDEGSEEGIVLKMNPFILDEKTKRQSAHSIFTKQSNGPLAIADAQLEKAIVLFKENLQKYVDNEKDAGTSEFACIYKNKFDVVEKEGGDIPVWYEYFGGMYYFAPAQLSRNVYSKRPSDFLTDKNLQRCTHRENLCEACNLFGFVSEKGRGNDDNAFGSRIRISDARCENPDCFEQGEKPLPILGSPRLSSFEFYLRHQNAGPTYYHADMPGVELAGRKAYWHNHSFNPRSLEAGLSPEMTSFKQWVKAGEYFEFELFFSKVTKDELEKLIFSLNFGENKNEGKFCHKIGNGKPLGFGSAKIIIDKVVTREFDVSGPDYCYSENTLESSSFGTDDADSSDFLPFDPSDVNIENIKKVANFKTIKDGALLHYPRLNGEIYEWFSANRIVGKNGFYKTLPLLSASIAEQKLRDDPSL